MTPSIHGSLWNDIDAPLYCQGEALSPQKSDGLTPWPLMLSQPKTNRARPVNLGGLDTNCTLIGLELLVFKGL